MCSALNNKKKLSIITICYNEPNLEETCESIVNQSWQDFEWIVIDGGSNKETLDIFDKYKYRINTFVSEPDNGIYNACNKGLKLARGEYIHFLNAGDAYYSDSVLDTVFRQNSYIEDVLYGEQQEINRNNVSQIIFSEQPEITKDFLINGCIQTSAAFIKRELFDKYGLFNENYKIVSDYEHFVIFFNNGASFKHLKLVVSKFDKSGISSNQKFAELHKKERNEVLYKYFSREEIEKALGKCGKLSFLEQIFSITNSCGKTHKIISIFGIHFRIRRNINA